MRFLIRGNPHTKISVMDEPGMGGACHKYAIGREVEPRIEGEPEVPAGEFGHVDFQNGPIKENGVNGCHQEDLLAIVMDRLQSFQRGQFACGENAQALVKVQEAMMWLNKRTSDRISRGVEGKNVI